MKITGYRFYIINIESLNGKIQIECWIACRLKAGLVRCYLPDTIITHQMLSQSETNTTELSYPPALPSSDVLEKWDWSGKHCFDDYLLTILLDILH